MLDLMRRQSTLIYFVFGAIIFIFAVNFGPGSSGCQGVGGGGPAYAARVNGESIRVQEFAQSYNQQFEVLRGVAEKQGVQLDPQMAERFGLKKRVIEELIGKRLLAQAASSEGILVSDDELRDHLISQYQMKDMSFASYEALVQRVFNTTVAAFEESVRQEIAARRLVVALTQPLQMTEDEVAERFIEQHDRARGAYVQIDIAPEKENPPSEEAINRALSEERAAVSALYEEESYSFVAPAKIRIRRIARDLDSEGGREAAATVLADARARLEGGEDFGAVAQALSQDQEAKATGGDLGLKTESDFSPELRARLFSMPAQSITPEPVEVEGKLALIQVTEVVPGGRQELGQVEREVARRLIVGRQADARARAQAESLLALAQKPGGFMAATALPKEEDAPLLPVKIAKGAKAKSVPEPIQARPLRHTTGWVKSSEKSLAALGGAPDAHRALFALTTPGESAPQVFKGGEAYFVLALVERERPKMAELATEKDTLCEEALGERRELFVRDYLEQLRVRAKIDTNSALVETAMGPTGAS